MKNQKTIFMGIDVSKKTLDFCVYDSQQNKNYSIKNNEKEKIYCTLVHCTLVQYGHAALKRGKEDKLFSFERRWEN